MKKIIGIRSGVFAMETGEGIRNRYFVEEKERIFDHLWLGEVPMLEVTVITALGGRILSRVFDGSREFCYDCLRKDPNLPYALREVLNEHYSRINNKQE